MTLRVRTMDANKDMTFGLGGANFLVDSPDAVAQIIGTKLLLWRGQWYVNLGAGVPFTQRILGYRNAPLSAAIINRAILSTPGVTGIENSGFSYDSTTRTLTVQADQIDTIFGGLRGVVAEQTLTPDWFTLDQSALDGGAPLE